MEEDKRAQQLPMLETKTPLDHRKGKVGIKYKRIAYLASKGLVAEDIAKDVNLTVDRVYKILGRGDVLEEANRFIRDSFKGSERFMVMLLDKALQALEDQILSGSSDEKKFAIDRVLKFFQAKGEGEKGNKTLIAQFFSGMKEGEQDAGKRLDEIILQKRRERGLPDYPDPDDL